jgi:uncharacterized protein YhbP (UPF0306 family)
MEQLGQRWVLSLATRDPERDAPYASSVFYALAPAHTLGRHEAPILIFASDPESAHGKHIALSRRVAGSVHHEATDIAQIRGVQLFGDAVVLEPTARSDNGGPHESARMRHARSCYLTRHPEAAPVLSSRPKTRLYALVVHWAKITDNQFGFGKHPEMRFSSLWE